MAIMVMVIAFSVMRTGDAKKKDKNKKTNNFGKTIRTVFAAVVVAVGGAIAVKLSKGKSMTQYRRKKILADGGVHYVPVLLSNSLFMTEFVKNDVLLIAAGVYWDNKYPQKTQVFDVKTFKRIKEIHEIIRKALPKHPTVPYDVDIDAIEKFEYVLTQGKTKQPVVIMIYERTGAGLKRIDTERRSPSDSFCDENSVCVRLLRSNGDYALLIPSTKGASGSYKIENQNDHEITQSDGYVAMSMSNGNFLIKTSSGFQLAKEGQGGQRISEEDKALVTLLKDLNVADIAKTMNDILRMFEKNKIQGLLKMFDGFVIRFWKQQRQLRNNQNISRLIPIAKSDIDEITTLADLVDTVRIYMDSLPRFQPVTVQTVQAQPVQPQSVTQPNPSSK